MDVATIGSIELKDTRLTGHLIAQIEKSHELTDITKKSISSGNARRSLDRLCDVKAQACESLKSYTSLSPASEKVDGTIAQLPDSEKLSRVLDHDKKMLSYGKTLLRQVKTTQLSHLLSYWIAALQMEIDDFSRVVRQHLS